MMAPKRSLGSSCHGLANTLSRALATENMLNADRLINNLEMNFLWKLKTEKAAHKKNAHLFFSNSAKNPLFII